MNTFSFIATNLRWLAGGLLLTVFSSFGQTFFIALFGGEIREAFALTHGEFGGIYMLGTLASAITLIWLGRVVDLYSVSAVSVVVCSALAIACLMMSMVSSVWMLVLVIFGLRLFGQGMMSHIAMVAMGRWYSAERGRAVSITSMGHQIGVGVLPLATVALVGLIGWRASWMVAAAVLMLCALPAVYLLMRIERIPRGQPAALEDGTLLHQWTRNEVLADPLFWLLLTTVIAPSFIGTSVFFHQAHIAEIKDWSRELIAASIALMSVTTIVFTLISGILIDRFNAKQFIAVFLVPLGVGCLFLAGMDTSMAIMLFMFLHGVANGVSNAVFGAIWPEVYGTRHLGEVRALVMAAMVIASAFGPGMTGWLIDVGVGFEFQLIVMGVYCLLTGVVMVPVTRALSRRSQAQVE